MTLSPGSAYLALWWIPRGHLPTTEEAEEAVRQLRAHGPTPRAFTLRAHFPPPRAAAAHHGPGGGLDVPGLNGHAPRPGVHPVAALTPATAAIM